MIRVGWAKNVWNVLSLFAWVSLALLWNGNVSVPCHSIPANPASCLPGVSGSYNRPRASHRWPGPAHQTPDTPIIWLISWLNIYIVLYRTQRIRGLSWTEFIVMVLCKPVDRLWVWTWTMWIYERRCQVSPSSALVELLIIAVLGPCHYSNLCKYYRYASNGFCWLRNVTGTIVFV